MATSSDKAKPLSATESETNFMRLSRLVMKCGTRVLQEVLDNIHPPVALKTVLSDPTIEPQLRRLPQPYPDILYPTPGTYGESKDFDITLLCRLLKCACGLPVPATGWNNEPVEADISLSADVVRLRFQRNKLAHSGVGKMEIQGEEFVAAWDNVKAILTRLAGSVSANNSTELTKTIDEMLKAPLTADEERYREELMKGYLQDMEVKQLVLSIDKKSTDTADKVDEILSILKNKSDERKVKKDHPQTEKQVIETAKLEESSLVLADLKLDVNFDTEVTETSVDGATSAQKCLVLREYQKELAEDALQGKNCIICAPTGSGKTIVALYIAWMHLEQLADQQDCNRKGKVLFIVNRVHLTSQQQRQFQTYLPSTYRVGKISGDVPQSFDDIFHSNDVVVSTAQIIADVLKDGRVTLSQFSLFIFDECHHTYGDHPYNKIMSHYLCLKLQPSMSATSLPQVIGLSASLGVGGSSNVEAAAENIIRICSTMDAQKLTIVQRNKEELKTYVSVPKVTLAKVPKQQNNKFERTVISVMIGIEKKVEKFNVPKLSTNERSEQPYRNWIEEVCAKGSGNRVLMTYVENLRHYHIALNIADVSRVKDAQNYLKRYFQGLDKSKLTEVDLSLLHLFEKMEKEMEDYIKINGEPSNPKLDKIKEMIIGFHAEDNTSRGILFTKTRESTLALEAWTKETDGLKDQLKAARITGTGGEVSQTASEQQKVIQDFDKGDVNLLIATTVAEEGLDIPECNYVIRLDMPGNEISTTQAQGRVRAQKGKYVAVGGDSSGFVDKEELNLLKGALMEKAVEYVKKMDEKTFEDKVKANQLSAIQQRNLKLQKVKQTRAQFEAEDVTFFCKKCGVLACKAHDFRVLREMYYVVVTEEIQDKITVKPHHKPWCEKGVAVNKKVHCNKCDADWGVMVTIGGSTLPSLKIKSFSLKMSDGSTKSIKTWSKRPFEIATAEFDFDFSTLF